MSSNDHDHVLIWLAILVLALAIGIDGIVAVFSDSAELPAWLRKEGW